MSYTTNSTANRLKINKGWKNPSFPEILPLYSRDNVFFFKLYLFLKAYFTLKKTKLIYCDLRTSENYTKILYLVINSVPKKLKKKKSFRTWYVRKTPSGLKYSKFRDANLRHAVNLLYLDLPKLKKQVSAKLLPLAKQKVNSAFYKKTRYKTWVNFLAKIKNVRNKNISTYKRNVLRFNPTLNTKLNFQQSLNYKITRLKNELVVLNRFFSILKSKKVLTKQNLVFYKTQFAKLKTKFTKLNSTVTKYNNNIVHVSNNTTKKIKAKPNFTKLNINKLASIKTQVHKKNLKKNLTEISVKKKTKAKMLLRAKALLKAKRIRKILKLRVSTSNKLVRSKLKAKRLNAIKILKMKKKKTLAKSKKKRKKLMKFISKSKLHKRLLQTNKIVNSLNQNLLHNYKTSVKTKWLSRLKKVQFSLRKKEQTQSRILSRNLTAISLIGDNQNKLKPTLLSDNLHKQLVHNVISIYTTYLKETSSINNNRTFAKFINLLKAQNLPRLNTKFELQLKTFNNNFAKHPEDILTKLSQISMLSYPVNLKPNKLISIKRARRGARDKFRFSILKKLRFKHKLQTDARTFSNKAYKYEVNTKKVSILVKNFAKNYKKVEAKLHKKQNTKKNIWKIRETLRQNYKTHAATLMKYQYKLGLQKILQNYFKMDFEVKVVRPLSQFKNLKFWRLVNQLRDYNDKKAFDYKIKKTLRKLNARNSKNAKSLISLRARYTLTGDRTKRFSKKNIKLKRLRHKLKNTYVFQKKSNIFQRLRQEELISFTQSRLFEVRRTLLIRSFMPIASMFMKFLDPQLLADHIAKEFEKTKHHQSIIYGLSKALRSLPFARGKGYRIAISGRINSSDKSRSYLLKRNVLVRQNFSRKVNFASSQARARIGSFGIKVWIFY